MQLYEPLIKAGKAAVVAGFEPVEMLDSVIFLGFKSKRFKASYSIYSCLIASPLFLSSPSPRQKDACSF